MYDIVLVDVTYSETQLAKDSSRFVFVEPALLRKVVEQLATRAELGDKPDVGLGCYDLVQLSNVRVVQASMVMYFASKCGGHFLRDLLDRHSRCSQTMGAESYLSVGT